MKLNRTAWVLLAGSLLTGCGSAEKVLTEYAANRWNALIQGDMAQAYEYYTDAFKATTPLDVFKRKVRGTGLWNRAKVDKVQCEESGKRCQVDVEVTVSMKMHGISKPVETSDMVHETWVKDGWFSDWRYVKE